MRVVDTVKDKLESVPVMVKHVAAIGISVGLWWTGYYVGEKTCETEATETISRMYKQLESAEERLRQLEKENFYDPFNWRKDQDG